jgi:hypothetical protein
MILASRYLSANQIRNTKAPAPSFVLVTVQPRLVICTTVVVFNTLLLLFREDFDDTLNAER